MGLILVQAQGVEQVLCKKKWFAICYSAFTEATNNP